jgi:hypothetical protein
MTRSEKKILRAKKRQKYLDREKRYDRRYHSEVKQKADKTNPARNKKRHTKEETQWKRLKANFETAIRKGYTNVCSCCGKLWCPENVRKITKDELYFDGHSKVFIDTVFAVDDSDEGEFCHTCITYMKAGKVPKLCLNNGLHFPNIDPDISDLNRVEERLISPRHVFQTIWPVMGPSGQYKTKGAIVNVPVNIDTTVNNLPRLPSDTNVIHVKVSRKLEYSNHYLSGFIRTKKVFDAARKIISKPLFIEHGIQLTIPNNMHSYDDSTSSEDEIESIDYESEEEINIHAHETMMTSSTGYKIAPAEGYRPKSVLLDPDLDFLAFPKLFGGYKLSPSYEGKPITYSDITKSMTMRYDRRVAHRSDYLLFMAKKLELTKLHSNISVCLRKKSLKNGHRVTANDMMDSSFVDGLVQHDDGYKVLKGVRSSSSHWKQEKIKVLAMIRQFGLPTFFMTLSSADTRWPELLVQLKKNIDNTDISEEIAATLPYKEKARLIQADPVTCALHFDKRLKCLKKLWNSPLGPFKGHAVAHHYHRIEFQQRG